MKKLMTLTFFIALVGLVALAPEALANVDSTAQGAGSSVITGINSVISGNIGLFIGVGLALFGLYTWLVAQNTGTGIIMIIGGVAVTAFPGLFEGMSQASTDILKVFAGSDGSGLVGDRKDSVSGASN